MKVWKSGKVKGQSMGKAGGGEEDGLVTPETLRGWAVGALCSGILALALAHPAIANREVLFRGVSLAIFVLWVLAWWRVHDLRAVVFSHVLTVGLGAYLGAGIASYFLRGLSGGEGLFFWPVRPCFCGSDFRFLVGKRIGCIWPGPWRWQRCWRPRMVFCSMEVWICYPGRRSRRSRGV